MKPEPHDYVQGGRYCACGLPRQNAVHTTDAEVIFDLRCREAGLPVMAHLFAVIADRRAFSSRSLLELARTIDVTNAYNDIVGPAIDQLEGYLAALDARSKENA